MSHTGRAREKQLGDKLELRQPGCRLVTPVQNLATMPNSVSKPKAQMDSEENLLL